MIKNAVLHPIGEQPMLADLLVTPQAADVSLLCTNLRTTDGKRPTSIEDQAGLFIIPLNTIRFIEASAESVEAVLAGLSAVSPGTREKAAATAPSPPEPSGNGHVSSEGNGHSTLEMPPGESSLVPLPGGELHGVLPDYPSEEDAAEELLRRIRDI